MKVLITGSNGQLGSEIKELASDMKTWNVSLETYLSWIFVIQRR